MRYIFALALLFSVQVYSWEIDEACLEGVIRFEDGDRMYFHAKDLKVTDAGIFIELPCGDEISLPNLQADEVGLYSQFETPELYGFKYYQGIRNRCHMCNQPRIVYCKNADCPVYQKRIHEKEVKKQAKKTKKNKR